MQEPTQGLPKKFLNPSRHGFKREGINEVINMFAKRMIIFCCLVITTLLVFSDETIPALYLVDLQIDNQPVTQIEVVEKEGVLFVNHMTFSQNLESRALPVVYSQAFSYGISDYWNNTFSLVVPGSEQAIKNGTVTKLEAEAFVTQEKMMTPLTYLCAFFNATYTYDGKTLAVSLQTAEKPEIPESIRQFIAELEKADFIVTQGNMAHANPLDLFAARFTPDCNANNAGNPYVLIQIPPHPEQAFANKLPFTYRLDENEAIVIVGKTPPACEFFSYRSYLLNRVCYETMSRNKIFASLGDTLNIAHIRQALNNPEPFQQPIMIISTANQPTDFMIRNAAKRAGIPAETIFTDIIPESIMNMGIQPNDDEFLFLHRTTHFMDEASMQSFLNNPGYYIFRITPSKDITELFFPIPNLTIRGTGVTEMAYTPVMERLQTEIINKFPDYTPTVFYSSTWLTEGYEAIQKHLNVMGESRDALYTRTDDFLLDEDDFLVVFGVNHHASGKSLYSNFSLYGSQYYNGQGGISNHQYAQTALAYLPNEPLAGDFYVWMVSRKPMEGFDNVLIVPSTQIPYGIPLGKKGFIGFRSYLEPSKTVGPLTSEIMVDRVILFSK